MKGLSPVMFEDFVKPYQINLEEVRFSFLSSLFFKGYVNFTVVILYLILVGCRTGCTVTTQ